VLTKNTFLTWLIASAMILTGAFWAWHSGVFSEVWTKDVTYLTSIISATFILVYSRLGRISWEIGHPPGIDSVGLTDDYYAKWLRSIKRRLKLGVFFGVFCFTLGIIGTVIGFILMLKSGGLAKDMTDPAVQQALLTGIIGHLATALYCTATGIIAGALIQVITFFLIYSLEAETDAR
jgi:hypothetical protein